jgi:hypothetical protein
MPSRKTRKQRKQKGGAGFLSMFSKPAPAPELPFESYLSSINRVYLFLYSKVKPTTPGYIPLQAGQKVLSMEQKDFFRSLLEPYATSNTRGRNTYRDEDFVREVLGVENVQTLTRQIQEVEAPNTPIQDVILNRPAIAQSFASTWGRFLPVILTSEKLLEYRQNWEQNICRFDARVDSNRPIKSLEENRCIVVYHTKDNLEGLLGEYHLVYGDSAEIGPAFPMIQVEKKYMPVMNNVAFPYTRIQASKLMKTSYVLDAFINNAVVSIEPNLAATIEKENKKLWNQYSLVKVVRHSKLMNHDIYEQKFISVVDEFPVAAGTYFLLSTLPTLANVKGMDVQSTLQMRTRYSSVWATLGTDPNLTFFQGLSYKEQIMFAVLQFKRYLRVLETSPDTAFQQVYLADLRVPATKEIFLSEIEPKSFDTYKKVLERHR